MMSAMNTAYGSTMSPGRLQQIRDTVEEYMKLANPLTDPWFQLWLPHLVKQLAPDLSMADDDVAMQLWVKLQDAPMLWYKSQKCNLAKYLLCIKRSREDVHLHAAKACLYSYACFQLGYSQSKVLPTPSAPPAGASLSLGL